MTTYLNGGRLINEMMHTVGLWISGLKDGQMDEWMNS